MRFIVAVVALLYSGRGFAQESWHVTVCMDRDDVHMPDYSDRIVDSVVRQVDSVTKRGIRKYHWVRVADSALFNHAVFQATALRKTTFSNSTFTQKVRFSDAVFQDTTNFLNDSFQKKVSFSRATFQKQADFYNVVFQEKVNFFETAFRQEANFYKAVFKQTADFSRLRLTDSSSFNFGLCILPDTISFLDIYPIKKDIDLLVIAFDSSRFGDTGSHRPYQINLYKSDISKFHLNYTYFRLLLKDFKGTDLPRDEAISLYEQLLKNFKDRGQQESYRKLDIEYQQYKWHTKDWYVRWFRIVPDWWWQFGYAKQRVFGWTVFLLFLFTLLTLPMLPFLQKSIYPLEALSKARHPYYHWRRQMWYSFVYTGTLFFKLTLKTEHIKFGSKPKHIMGTLYVLLVYTLGVVCLAYMANFVLQK